MSAAPEMKITAIVPWMGSKRSMAPVIVRELGKHRSYWNPCVGSFAVELAKPRSAQEHVNDLHGDLINLANVIRHQVHGPALYRRLRRTLNHEVLFYECRDALAAADSGSGLFAVGVDLDPLERAYLYFIVSWMGRNGVTGTERVNYQPAVRWTSGGGHGGVRLKNAVDSIPSWRRRMRSMTILQRDLFDILPKIEDQDGTAIYVDPPYLRSGARSGSCAYKHEFKTTDHHRLERDLLRFKKARVVVSYYDDETLSSMYPGWTRVDCTRQKNLHVQNRRGAGEQDAPEILIINGPSYSKSTSEEGTVTT